MAVYKEVRDSCGAVMGDPFEAIRPLVSHACDGQNVHGRGPMHCEIA
jgi:hypothetical protein